MAAPAPTGATADGGFGVSTSRTVNAPTRAAENLLLVPFYYYNTGATITTPSGWALVAPFPVAQSTFRLFVYARIADGTSADNWSMSFANAFNSAAMAVIAGNDPVTPIPGGAAVGADATGTGTSLNVTGLTTPRDECFNVIFQNTDTAHSLTPPAGFTAFLTGGAVSLLGDDQPTAGASGNKTGNYDAPEVWANAMFTVQPPSSSATRIAMII